MACAAGLYKAFDRFPKELVSVIIGEGNHVGEAGALAMASRCEGVKQLLHSCPLLEDISIGGHHHRRAFSDGDILTECSTIEVLDAGGRRLDQDGEENQVEPFYLIKQQDSVDPGRCPCIRAYSGECCNSNRDSYLYEYQEMEIQSDP